ncbi:MAG TPA: M20/M25/M40 family metallo-hydrolase [Gammaproteobacteria bacterium]|nr:M20/M25/M40 family metallo-hydrolase [Gammaproteobacteria bacterium]
MPDRSDSFVPTVPGGVLLLALLATAIVLALAWPPAVPPPVVPATAEATAFSAERARVHLRELTRSPRPAGTTAHAAAREYLLDALRGLDLAPEVQRATGVRRSGGMLRAAAVVNVMARMPGTDSSAAVVLLSHYDSVPSAPGASDAGHGVAAILEAVRALRAGGPLRNDVIVLITDAEEMGLLGAQAWVDEHPWAADTGIVLNAEGRGYTGPVQMFRTTAGNGRMIRTLAQAAPYPAAVSLANEIFKRLPNDTDLTVFEKAGHAGMDFANVHGLTHYHTPLDNFDNADPRTLQHHGGYLLSLARAFGDMDLASLAAPDRVYFSLPVLGMVHYPQAWALPMAALAVLLLVVVAIAAHRRDAWRVTGVMLGVVHLAAALVLLPLMAIGAWHLLAGLLPEVAWFSHGSPYGSGRYLLGIGLLATALYAVSFVSVGRRLAPADLLLAATVSWAALAVASALHMPGASYLFLWPLLFATAGLACWRPRAMHHPFALVVALGLTAWPAVLLLAPVIEGVEVALTLDRVAMPVALLVLGLGLLALQIELLRRSLGPAVPGLLAVTGLAVLAAAVLGAGIDSQRRKANGVHYIADLDADAARWYSLDPAPDEWTRLYLGDDPERAALPEWAPAQLIGAGRVVWQRPAPVLRSRGPHAELLADDPTEQGRRMRFRLTAPPGAHSTVIRFPGAPAISGLRIDGREVPPDALTREPTLVYYAMRAEGAELEIFAADRAPVKLYLRSNILGLPPTDDGAMPLRPDHLMPASQLGDLTRLQRSLTFP